MLDYLNFFLYNKVFEIIVGILFVVNMILINYLDNLQTKKEIKKAIKNNKIKQYKLIITLLVSSFSLIYLFFKFKNLILTILLFILPFFTLMRMILNVYNNKNNFSLDDKYLNIFSTIIFLMFFSTFATPIYFESCAELQHIHKEILLILYLIIKIILFVFLTFSNLFIFISNINTFIKYKNSKSISEFFIYKKKEFSFIDYDFLLYRNFKNNQAKIIDIIIFTLLCTPTIVINSIIIIFLYFIKTLKNKLFDFFKHLENDKNWNLIIKKATNISIIISFIIVYCIMVIFEDNFNSKLINIYTFLSTVILLPLIYDSIKSNK